MHVVALAAVCSSNRVAASQPAQPAAVYCCVGSAVLCLDPIESAALDPWGRLPRCALVATPLTVLSERAVPVDGELLRRAVVEHIPHTRTEHVVCYNSKVTISQAHNRPGSSHAAPGCPTQSTAAARPMRTAAMLHLRGDHLHASCTPGGLAPRRPAAAPPTHTAVDMPCLCCNSHGRLACKNKNSLIFAHGSGVRLFLQPSRDPQSEPRSPPDREGTSP